MSVKIVTGYTGERHITPLMDAEINRGIFGEDGCILSSGNQMVASMPNINTFVMADGAFSIQGHIGITDGEQLTVDTCATGMRRIDLVVARFAHDTSTNIDSMTIELLKGEETSSQYPTTPTYNTGVIAEGADADLVLYRIDLNGSTVTFELRQKVHASGIWQYSRDNDLIDVEGNTSDTGYNAIRTDTGVSAYFGVGAGGINHGIWSRTNNHWMIYEDNNGVARISSDDLRVGGHSSGIGSIVQSYLTANKSCANNKWYALCSIVLTAGVWIIEAGVRWSGNGTGSRIANVSSTSADNGQNICVGPSGAGVPTSVRYSIVVTPTANTRYYLNVNQTSGATLTCASSGNNTGNFLRAVRIL